MNITTFKTKIGTVMKLSGYLDLENVIPCLVFVHMKWKAQIQEVIEQYKARTRASGAILGKTLICLIRKSLRDHLLSAQFPLFTEV